MQRLHDLAPNFLKWRFLAKSVRVTYPRKQTVGERRGQSPCIIGHGAVLTLGEAGIDLKANSASCDIPLIGEWEL